MFEAPQFTACSRLPYALWRDASVGTLSDANRFYRDAIKGGAKGILVPFDLATSYGYDSDDTQFSWSVSQEGLAVDSIDDMKALLRGIPLDKVSTVIDTKGALLPVLACIIAAGEELGIDRSRLKLKLQHSAQTSADQVNKMIYPPESSRRIIRDVILYSNFNLPEFHNISIVGGPPQPTLSGLVQSLSGMLLEGRECLRSVCDKRQDAHCAAQRLSFAFYSSKYAELDTAAILAARHVWQQIFQEFVPAEQACDEVLLQPQPFPCGDIRFVWSQPSSNLEGLQGLPRPSDAAQKAKIIASHILTQIRRNDEPANSRGTAARTASAFRTAEIGPGRTRDRSSDIDQPYAIQAKAVKSSSCIQKIQALHLAHLRENRDQADCDAALSMVEASAKIDKGNLLELAVDAARARATVGEISMALEKSFGRIATLAGLAPHTQATIDVKRSADDAGMSLHTGARVKRILGQNPVATWSPLARNRKWARRPEA